MSKLNDENAPKEPSETTPYPNAQDDRRQSAEGTATSPSPGLTGLGTPVPDDREARRAGITASTTPAPPAGPAEFQTRFSPGQIVANRYKVKTFIGQGGMGEVYEVEDLELKERVALKTIRPEVAQDQKMIERFKREIQLARNVTHPNVCRIFDLGFHRTGEPSGDLMFLTMELLNGETLAARIRRVGRMKPSEALPVVVQMAAALAAAHKAGIIHRDFKTGNVILVPSKENTRVVVTDFGLARRSQPSGAAAPSQTSQCQCPDFPRVDL